jgi:hypothetical protein
MQLLQSLVLLLAGLAATQAMAWENHCLASYRAFENMPEVAAAPSATVETLDAFLRAEEYTLEALLASQEAWARANIEKYPARPPALAFKADGSRSDEVRRLAFLRALRVAPDSRFALYFQSDPWSPSAANAMPEPTAAYRYLALKPGDLVTALAVLASATDEPDFALDNNLFEDNASEWGKTYGFGPQPYGNTASASASQLPFHSGYLHESQLVSLALPNIKRSLVLLRFHQYSTLASLAFRTGHGYWGWRFAGLSLHYLQDLTQPYRATLAPGESGMRLLSAYALSMSGLSSMKADLLQLQANRSLALEKYQTELLQRAATNKLETALEKALHKSEKDKSYPDWNDRYLRDVVSLQASRAAPALAQTLVLALPAVYVWDSGFDFAARQAGVHLLAELSRRDSPELTRLDASLAELLGNFGAHSRNALRSILRASNPL